MEIRPIKKSEWGKLRVFNETEYGAGHVLTDKKYCDWQFDNPFNPNPDSYTILGLFGSRGELLGTFGFFISPFNFFGRTVNGISLCNLIVKKSLRSLGYGYLLLEKAADLGDLAIDHTINNNAWPMFMKSGWKGEDLKRYLYIIKPKNRWYDLPASPHFRFTEKAFHFDRTANFDSDIEAFWNKIKNRYPITVERSPRYLNWRFGGHDAYQKFILRDASGILALVVFRFEEVSDGSGSLGVKIGRIIEFVSDSGAESLALEAAIDYCRSEGSDLVDYFESGGFHQAALHKIGFVSGENPPYSDLPILLRPIDQKRMRLNFAVKIINQDLMDEKTADLRSWYTNKSGGDQDRP